MTFARLIVVRRFSSSTERKLWRVIFYGSDSFSLKSLQTLNENRLKKTDIPQVVDSIKVVCPKLKSLVADYALKEDLPVSEWPYAVPNNTFDVGVVVSFGHLIPASSIHACKYGMINVHPSLLPRWRGAAPLVHTLLAGDTESGISVITVAPKRFDTGKIVMQRTVAVPQGIHLVKYTSMMAILGANLMLLCLQDLPVLLSTARDQGSEGVTRASKISPSMGAVCWAQHTAEYVDRLYRAVGNFTTLTTSWHGCRVKLFDMVPPEQLATAKLEQLVKTENVKPGHCYYHAKRKILCIKCKEGWVAFSAITVKGHKRMTATDFSCGFLGKVPEHERYFSDENKVWEAAVNTRPVVANSAYNDLATLKLVLRVPCDNIGHYGHQ